MHSNDESQEQSLELDLQPEEATAPLPEIEFESPGRFAIHNPPSEVVSADEPIAAPFRLGEPTPLQRFSLATDASAHALALLQQARRSLCIYSDDLDPWLYNNRATLDACSKFLLASPKNRLRILIRDPSRLIRDGHRLLSLSRKLSSSCWIRKMNPDYPAEEMAFLLADGRGLLMRPDPGETAGYVLYEDLGRGRQCQGQFDQAWETSVSDPNLRSMLL
ncbi:DUF7931 domain-containing protein [Pseudomonas mangrovi]|uniref:DUF7931 domain-containing protein n=1 Tax=Pseudomonas mangrovi TaxID=2161748 RepID=UPI0026BE9D93